MKKKKVILCNQRQVQNLFSGVVFITESDTPSRDKVQNEGNA